VQHSPLNKILHQGIRLTCPLFVFGLSGSNFSTMAWPCTKSTKYEWLHQANVVGNANGSVIKSRSCIMRQLTPVLASKMPRLPGASCKHETKIQQEGGANHAQRRHGRLMHYNGPDYKDKGKKKILPCGSRLRTADHPLEASWKSAARSLLCAPRLSQKKLELLVKLESESKLA
jgi:hypothetical protein